MSTSLVTRIAAAAVAGALALSSPLSAAPTRKRRARTAVRYVVSQQRPNGSIPAFSRVGSTADAVVSMVAARRAPRQIGGALDYLRAQAKGDGVDGVGTTAKVVMAVAAAERRPRRFGGRNLVREIKATQTAGGRYGEETAVFDHALGMLAIAAAGGSASEEAVSWLVEAQCGDGGWQYDEPAGAGDDEHCEAAAGDDPFASDTNTTALAIQALAATPGAPDPEADPFGFFTEIRDQRFDGWGYSWDFAVTDANSTAMVIQAHEAESVALPNGARRALARLQYRLCGDRAGAFAFTWIDEDGDGNYEKSGPDLGATIAAIPGLLGKALPISSAAVTKPAPRRRQC